MRQLMLLLCAWVLWEEVSIIGGVNERPWRVLDAATSRETCLATLARTIQETHEFFPMMMATKNSISWKNPDPKPGQVLLRTSTFRCLPDTIEPRGPKK